MTFSFILLYGTCFLTLLYAVFLWWVATNWQKGKLADPATNLSTTLPLISVIIPARNEAANIAACLQSVLAQDYPPDRMEVIVIDDHSSDGTAARVSLVKDARIQLLLLAEHPPTTGKKAALKLGIQRARGALIVTTDADVIAPPTWLPAIATAHQAGAQMILGAVRMAGPPTLLTAWQGLDVAGTMLLTGAAVHYGKPLLANGANLAFTKSFFATLGDYQGNENLASGDDIFLLQKAVRRDPGAIKYLFNATATVSTQAENSWRALFWQRLRWAGKTSAYRDPYLIVFQGLVYGLCWTLLLLLPLAFSQPSTRPFVGLVWSVKLFSEAIYLAFAAREIGEYRWLRWLLPVQIIHPFYIAFIGTLALLPISFYWKGRRVK